MKCYVMFHTADHPRWWMKFLKKDMQHCWIAKAHYLDNGEELLLTYENLYGYASMELSFVSVGAISDLIHGVCIVEYETEIDPYDRSWIPEPITCVTSIKKIMGIHKTYIQTPFQLYKYLLDNGGKIYGVNV